MRSSGLLSLMVLAGGCPDPTGAGLGTTTGEASTDTTAVSTATPTTGGADSSTTAATDTGATDTTGGAEAGSTFSGETASVPEICNADGEPALEIGHGYEEFLPLDSGPARLIHGPQGGIHITIGLRSAGLDVAEFGDVHMYGESEGEVVADHPQGAVLECLDDLGVAEAIWLSMVLTAEPADVHGKIIDMEVSILDGVGTMISAQASTMIWDEEAGGSGSDSGSDSGSGSDGDSGGSTTTG